MKDFFYSFPILLLLISQLFSCSSVDEVARNFKLSDKDKIALQKVTPTEALKNSNDLFITAKSDKLIFYSPRNFEKSNDFLVKAQLFVNNIENKPLIKKIKDKEQLTPTESEQVHNFYKNLALVSEYIKEGRSVKIIVERELKNVLLLNKRLTKLNSMTIFPNDHEDIMEKMADIIETIEKEKEKCKYEDRPELTIGIKKLIAKTIIKVTLGKAKMILAEIDNKELDEYVPKTLKTAINTLNSSTQYIKNNPENAEGVEKVGKETLLAANHAFYIAQEVQAIKTNLEAQADAEIIENYVLKNERLMNNIREAFKMEDIRNHSLQDQSQILSNKAQELIVKIATINRKSSTIEGPKPAQENPLEKEKNLKNKIPPIEKAD